MYGISGLHLVTWRIYHVEAYNRFFFFFDYISLVWKCIRAKSSPKKSSRNSEYPFCLERRIHHSNVVLIDFFSWLFVIFLQKLRVLTWLVSNSYFLWYNHVYLLPYLIYDLSLKLLLSVRHWTETKQRAFIHFSCKIMMVHWKGSKDS